jgi:bifunctional non-homologous end joining protein LigD
MAVSVASRVKRRKSALASVPGARRSDKPGFIEPCDPTLRDSAPSGAEWLHEIKSDGYRAQAHIRRGNAMVYSRSGYDWTEQFRGIADALRGLQHEAIIDGEAVVLGSRGVPDYEALRRELGRKNSGRLIFHAFDLLYLDGFDLRQAPLIERKRLLRELLEGAQAKISYIDFIEEDGEAVFAHACRLGVEGIISKRKDAPYRSGRVESWLKRKCTKSDDYPIIAFVEKLGAKPRRIASLYIGRYEGDKLLYAGKVRTGYTEASAREVREVLDPLVRTKSPLAVAIKKPKATWVEPRVRCEVQYGGINEGGILREAVFKGLRDDATLSRVRAPRIVPSKAPRHPGPVPRENILQLLPDAVAPSREELAAYWKRVWKKALPYLGHRPLKLVRHIHGTTFYHKGPLPPIPSSVHQLKVQKREGGEGTRLWVDGLDGFLGLVDIGAVELHPWNSTVDDIEHADVLVIDLDPGEGVEWERVVEASLRMRDLLREEGLDSWPKLTGGKGVHLMAPLEERQTHDRVHALARRLCAKLVERHSWLYILSAQAQRRGRIFLDYLRNGRGTTAIGTYSPRARQGFPIAAPTTWERIENGIRPDAYTMAHPFRERTLTRECAAKAR